MFIFSRRKITSDDMSLYMWCCQFKSTKNNYNIINFFNIHVVRTVPGYFNSVLNSF